MLNKPVITNPAASAVIHFNGNQKTIVTVTVDAAEQVVKVYIGGALAGSAYSETGGTVAVPNIQLVAGSNVLTAKSMEMVGTLSAASDAVTVTGVNTAVSGDVDIISYIEDNLIDWLKANATITALLAGAESIYHREFPDTIEIYPALRIFDIKETTTPQMACYSLGIASFSIEAVKLDNYKPGEGVFGNTNYGDTYQGASDIINTVRVQLMASWKSCLGELFTLTCDEKIQSDIKKPAGGYYITFSGMYRKPKQTQE